MKFCPECEREFDTSELRCPDDGTQLVVMPEERSLVGQRLDGRFQIVEKIGSGGMGSVYRAIQEPIGRQVALKVLRRQHVENASTVKRFFHEAKIVSRLRHPNTVTLYDFGQAEEGQLFIAMELMRGTSLDDVRLSEKLTVADIVQIGKQVCQSLGEAHENGIVHRDLKPSNIYIDFVAGRRVVKVLDFGIAKAADAGTDLTLTGMVVGTPAYMSPEQTVGHDLDPRSDLYSLGVVLYELLSGAPPFAGEQAVSIAMAQLTKEPEDLRLTSQYRDLPESLAALVGELLAKDPEERPPSALAVEQRLEAIARELGAEGQPWATPSSQGMPSSSLNGSGGLRAISPLSVATAETLDSSDGMVALREREGESIPPTLAQPLPESSWGTGPMDVSSPVQDTLEQPRITPGSIATVAEALEGKQRTSLRSVLAMLLLALTGLGAVWAFLASGPEEVGENGAGGGETGAEVEPAGPGASGPEGVAAVVGAGAEGSGAVVALGSGAGSEPVAALVAYGEALGRASSSMDEAIASARAVAVEPPAAPTVELRFESEPAGATVRRDDDDSVLCEPTPCAISLEREAVIFDVRVMRRRYRPERLSVAAASDATYEVTLERLPQSPEQRERPRDEEPRDEPRETPRGVDLMAPVTFETEDGAEEDPGAE